MFSYWHQIGDVRLSNINSLRRDNESREKKKTSRILVKSYSQEIFKSRQLLRSNCKVYVFLTAAFFLFLFFFFFVLLQASGVFTINIF